MSYVEGTENQLFYRGIDVRSLTEHSSYEEVAYLLLFGLLPNREQLDEFMRRMAASRRIPGRHRHFDGVTSSVCVAHGCSEDRSFSDGDVRQAEGEP